MRNQKVMRFVKRIISLPILFLIGCGDVYEPEVSVEPYCNMPVVDGVPTLALRDTWQDLKVIYIGCWEIHLDILLIEH